MPHFPSHARVAIGATLLLALGTACAGDPQSEQPIDSSADGLAASVSMSGDSADALGVAMVRVVNAAPGAPELSLRADSATIVSAVGYESASAYRTVDDTWINFQATTAGRNNWQTLDTNREMLVSGHRYSIIVLPSSEGNGFDTRVVRDDVPRDNAKAIVRLVHAAVGVGAVSLGMTGDDDTLFDSVDLGDEAGFEAIDPTSKVMLVKNEDGKTIATLSNTNFEAGVAYTLVLSLDASGSPHVFVIRDAVAG